MADPRDPNEIEEDDGLIETDEGSDAGQVDDDGGYEAEAGQEPEGAQAQERVDRRSRRDDTLREELRAEREHRARVEAELNIIRQEREQRQQQSQNREETDQEFAARIALLEPLDQMNARLDRATNQHKRQLALQSFALLDRSDKQAYDLKAASDPVYRKYQAQVEQTLAAARRQGYSDLDRETVLDLVRGRAMRANAAKGNQAQRQGQQRIQSQQARTTGGRGDQGRDQRPRRYAANDMSPEAVRQRLESPDAYI